MLRRMVTSLKIKLLDLPPQQHHNENLKTRKCKLLHASRAVAFGLSLPSVLAPSVDRVYQSELLEIAPTDKNVAMRQKQTRRIAKSLIGSVRQERYTEICQRLGAIFRL
jgi:hypothetical protein